MKISVAVTSYNHERYIAQCLESILMQQGDFQLEVIVGDDYSTDRTLTIIEGFQNRYPNIISILPAEKNLGITKNLKRCLDACSGECIAICEGDDYWTEEYKLQKQKDFLETRRDCSMCFSAILLDYEEKNITMPHPAQAQLQKDVLAMEDLIGTNPIGNFSCCMYRTEVIRKFPPGIYDLEINTDDWIFAMASAQFGKIGFIPEIMSTYRIHSAGAWSGKNPVEQLESVCKHMDVSNKFFDYKYDVLFRQRKQYFQDEIIRLRAAENAQNHNDSDSTSTTNKAYVPTMNVLFTMFRSIKDKLREIKQRYNLRS